MRVINILGKQGNDERLYFKRWTWHKIHERCIPRNKTWGVTAKRIESYEAK